MRASLALAAALGVAGALAPGAWAGVERSGFQYERALSPAREGPIVLEPDGPLFAHARGDLGDVRIVDTSGREVPWRPLPQPAGAAPKRVPALDSGRRGRAAVALFDLGPARAVRDRIELEIPDRDFVGRAVVFGADDRGGPFTRLSVTEIYDVRGGEGRARSTVAVFPRSDFRWLMVRISGVRRIAAANVSGTPEQPPLIPRPPRAIAREERGSRTVLTVDLGYENLPVDELRIEAATGRYERQVEVLGSNDGRSFTPLTTARISRFADSDSAPIALAAGDRYLRVEIENGDDPPLRGVKVSPASRSRALLGERGRPGPLTVLYGNPRELMPDYDYARIPIDALELSGAAEGRLGEERMNPRYEPPPDTRSFSARHPRVVAAALALAALALGGVGLIALRSRPRTAN